MFNESGLGGGGKSRYALESIVHYVDFAVFRLVYHKFAFDAKLAQNQLNVQEARA
jgi:hypothetical protein